jgi:inner membrane protein
MRSRRAAALGCLATIALADAVIHRRKPRWILVGFLDHPAHAATAGLMLLNAAPRSRGWALGFMAGSLLPDMDHIPLALGPEHPTGDDPRPVSHCLAAVAPLALVALASGNDRIGGAAAGCLAHFARDLATGPGAPLLWPLSPRELRAPYPLYLSGCALLALRAGR